MSKCSQMTSSVMRTGSVEPIKYSCKMATTLCRNAKGISGSMLCDTGHKKRTSPTMMWHKIEPPSIVMHVSVGSSAVFLTDSDQASASSGRSGGETDSPSSSSSCSSSSSFSAKIESGRGTDKTGGISRTDAFFDVPASACICMSAIKSLKKDV